MGLDVFQLARRSHGKILEVEIDLLSLQIPQSQVETGGFRADALPEGMEEDDLCDDQFAR